MFARTAVSAIFAAAFASSALAASCARTYTVQAGEYCDAISAAQNVSTYQLAVVNPQINQGCTNLLPGQSLCLGNTGEDCQTTYKVVSGNTCDDLTKQFNINSTILYANNPQINADCSNLYIDEVLCVAGGVQVPPAPANGAIPATSIPATATAAVPTHSAPTPSPTPSPTGDDEDDDDLPFCDEL